VIASLAFWWARMKKFSMNESSYARSAQMSPFMYDLWPSSSIKDQMICFEMHSEYR
jgi:hypothetical protein